MNTAVRDARIEDIDHILEIDDPYGTPWNRSQYLSEIMNRFSSFIVILDENLLAGYAVVWSVADELQLNKIAVKKELRHKGLGRVLIQHCIEMGIKEGRTKIHCEVSEKNLHALSFYRKNGFRETGRRKNYYPDADAILMEKVLLE